MNTWKIAACISSLGIIAFFVWRYRQPKRPWVVSMHTYEGFPLALRRPTNVDTPANRERYPFLAVLTHEFSKRHPDGRPEHAYNESLFDFDIAITSSFDSPPSGVPVLVETFGGKRIYYFYVAPDTDVAAAVDNVTRVFPAEKLTWEVSSKNGWGFLDRYAEDFFPKERDNGTD